MTATETVGRPTCRRWHPGLWPERERAEAWRETVSRTHLGWQLAADPDDAVPPGAQPGVTAQRIDDLALLDCTTGPCSGHRGRREIAGTDGEFVGVLVVLTGREHVQQDGHDVDLGPGSALVWDSTRPAHFAVPGPLVKRTLLVPRERLGALLPRGGAGPVTPLAPGPATRLLTDYLAALSGTAGALAGPAAAAAASAALELLAAVVAPGVPPGDRAVWERVRAFVEANLGDPDLRPARIASAGALSLRALYLLFERHGETVSGYVRRRRLARAHADLARLGVDTTVARVAHRWGFADQSGFARAFRRQYDCTPDDVRRGRS